MVALNKPFRLFSVSECNEIIEQCKLNDPKLGTIGTKQIDTLIRNNNVYPFHLSSHNNFLTLFQKIDSRVTWLEEPCQISCYKKDQCYNWHIDQIQNYRTSNRILTLTCTLKSAPGAFFETEYDSFDLDNGEAIIIKSEWLHRATAPTKHARWAFTVWGMGPNPLLNTNS